LIIADNVGIFKYHVSTAMRTAISMHVAEILRDAGPKVNTIPNHNSEAAPDSVLQGKHVAEIAQPTKVHPGKLGRYLGRYQEAFYTVHE
jgi:hypothetical protein